MTTIFAALFFAAQVAVPLKVCDGNSLQLVDCSLNGKPCTLIFDTGATHTTLDLLFVTNAIPDAKLYEVEMMGTSNVRLRPRALFPESFKVGLVDFQGYPVMVLDTDAMPRPDGRRLAGILGMDIIGRMPVLLSLADSCAIFNAALPEGFSPPLKFDERDYDGSAKIVCEVGGKAQTMLVDSGSSWTFVIGEPGIGNRETESGEQGTRSEAIGINGREELSMWRGDGSDLKLKLAEGGDLILEGVKPPFNGSMPFAYLGADTLRQYDIYLNLPEVRLRKRAAK